jgi:putative membrane protein
MDSMMNMQSGSGGFFAEWSPGLLLVLIVIAYVYFQLIGPMRQRFAGSSEVPTGKKILFIASLLVFYAGQGSPINYYGHGMIFSSHMLQQSLIYLVFPPMILLSVPDWLIRPVLMKPSIRRLVSPLLHPLITVVLFNVLFSFYHIPQIFNYAFDHPILHNLYHLVLVITAFQMWFPVFCPLPEWKQLSELQKMAYIFANGVLLTPACALIIFSSSLLYPAYAEGIQMINFGMSPLEDQQLGGTLMKIIQEIVYGSALAYTFFRWYRKEKKKEDEDQAALDRELLQTSPLQSN